MCRAASTIFQPDRTSPRRGRTWALRVLLRWGLAEPAGDDTAFLASDLISNAIAHTGTPVTLTLTVARGSIEVAVADTAPLWMSGIPRQAAVMVDPPAGQSGRDSMSLGFLDDDCAVSPRGVGGQPVAQQPIAKQIWFRRSVPAGWAFTDGCPCDAAGPVDQPLASGRDAIAVSGPWDLDDRAPPS
jgi:hypothetical protein